MIFLLRRERVLLGSITLACLLGWGMPMWAATDTNIAAATQLVRAQLPRGTSLIQADSEMLAGAVSRAILDHRPQAPAILSAALIGGVREKGVKDKGVGEHSCDFVTRVFEAALRAAPEQASALTDAASSLYPDCADQLLAAVLHAQDQHLSAYDYKDRPDFKDRRDYKDRAGAPVAGIIDPGIDAMAFGYDLGFGAGFPGAIGFVGSPPSGGVALPLPPVALPPPGGVAVTPVVNE